MKSKNYIIIGGSAVALFLLWKIVKKKKLTTTGTDSATNPTATGGSNVTTNPLDVVPTNNSSQLAEKARLAEQARLALLNSQIAPIPKNYFSYKYGIAQSGCTIYWANKDGSKGSAFVDKGSYYIVPCMLEGSGSGCGQWTKLNDCSSSSTTVSTPTYLTPIYSVGGYGGGGENTGYDRS
jgi:hypothetical protein